MYRIIDGKTVSQGVKDSVRDELTALKTEMGLTAGLAVKACLRILRNRIVRVRASGKNNPG